MPSSKRDASKAINGEFDENNKQVIATMFVPVEMAFDTNRGGMSLRKFYELKESASLLEPVSIIRQHPMQELRIFTGN